MKKCIIIAAIAASLVGCKSIDVDRHASTVATVTAADGTVQVVKDKDGNPIILDGGWSVDYFQHWNWQKFDSLAAKAGSAELSINNYSSGADTNLTALVSASVEGATKLVASIGEAYVKIAGGGAQADTVMSLAQKVYSTFSSSGGDASKATVTSTDGKLTVSDGTTFVECDASGNCTSCTLQSN